MLINFKVKNFRSIKDEVTLDLQATSDKTMVKQSVFEDGNLLLLKSAGIYGPNASGKSNIFKAFMVFKKMILESLARSNMPDMLPNECFKLSSSTENKPSFFEITFVMDDEVFVYGFRINKKKINSEWLEQKKGKKTLFKRKGQKIESNKNYFKESTVVLKKQTTEKVLFLSVLASNNGTIAKKIIQFMQKTNHISGTDRGNTLDFSFGQFSSNPRMAQQMKDFMVQADFGIVDIKASQKMVLANQIKNIPDKFKELFFKEDSKIAKRSLKFLHKKYDNNNREIENEALDFFTEESEGTQQMFALSAPIINTLNNGGILFIDEIDSSLHPILCQYLILLFNSNKKNPHNAQLIFTTHDISLLGKDLLRRDQIYFSDKGERGATRLFSLADISERKNVDFAKRYLEGRYDALPYINDLEDLKFNK